MISGGLDKAFLVLLLGFPGGSVGKESTCQSRVPSLNQEDSLEIEVQSTPVFLPGESHGQRSLVSYSSWGHKELDTI